MTHRYPLPEALLDPAFTACLRETLASSEMLAEFDRLCATDLSCHRPPVEQMVDAATGKKAQDVETFVRFVHDILYERIPDEAIEHFRSAAERVQSHLRGPGR